jgi:hypothetical protein
MRVVVIRMHTLDLPSISRVDERVDIKLNHAMANLPPDASRMAHAAQRHPGATHRTT